METFDLEQTQRFAALKAVPQEQHDDAWCADFLRAAAADTAYELEKLPFYVA